MVIDVQALDRVRELKAQGLSDKRIRKHFENLFFRDEEIDELLKKASEPESDEIPEKIGKDLEHKSRRHKPEELNVELPEFMKPVKTVPKKEKLIKKIKLPKLPPQLPVIFAIAGIMLLVGLIGGNILFFVFEQAETRALNLDTQACADAGIAVQEYETIYEGSLFNAPRSLRSLTSGKEYVKQERLGLLSVGSLMCNLGPNDEYGLYYSPNKDAYYLTENNGMFVLYTN